MNVKELLDIPYTISYVIRKRIQVDNLNELPKDKRPPDSILWEGTTEQMEDWLNRVVYNHSKVGATTVVDVNSIEG